MKQVLMAQRLQMKKEKEEKRLCESVNVSQFWDMLDSFDQLKANDAVCSATD